MKKSKTQKGITLIALIITIVVLLILAVVTINAIQGDGIIEYAKNAADEYTSKANEEQEKLNTLLGQIEGSLSEETKITWTKTSEGDLAVGSAVVTSTGENFYVIGFKDNNETVKLLAKDCIDTIDLIQSASAGELSNTVSAGNIAFCEESVIGYWGTGTSPYNIEETQPIPSTHTAAYAADRYGAKLGVTGRLMLHSEAEDLDNDEYRDILCGRNGKSSVLNICYWLGSANSADAVWQVEGLIGMYGDYVNSGLGGVRPVIEISKSNIS